MPNLYYSAPSYLEAVRMAMGMSCNIPFRDWQSMQNVLLGTGSTQQVVFSDSFNTHYIGASVLSSNGTPYGISYFPNVALTLSERWNNIKNVSFRTLSTSYMTNDVFIESPFFKVGSIAHTSADGLTTNDIVFVVQGSNNHAAPPFLLRSFTITNASGVYGCVFSEGSPVAGYSPSGAGSGPTNQDLSDSINSILTELNDMDFSSIVDAIDRVKDEVVNVVTPLEAIEKDISDVGGIIEKMTDFNDTVFPTLISPLEAIESDLSGVGGMIEKTAAITPKLTILGTNSEEANRQLSLVVSAICRIMSKVSDIPSTLVFDGENKNAENMVTKIMGGVDPLLYTYLSDIFKFTVSTDLPGFPAGSYSIAKILMNFLQAYMISSTDSDFAPVKDLVDELVAKFRVQIAKLPNE